MEEVLLMLKNCISFGLVENKTQNLVGYARVLTDEIKYAYIFDVMVDEKHRGEGLGKQLLDAIIQHPKLQHIKYFELTCVPEMMAFYENFGFSGDYGEVRPMRYSRYD